MTRVCIVATGPANTPRWPSAGPMLVRRRRRVNVSCLVSYESTYQQTRDAIPIPVQCWARVTDPGPTPAPAHVTCSLGMHGKSNYGGNDLINPCKKTCSLRAGSTLGQCYRQWTSTDPKQSEQNCVSGKHVGQFIEAYQHKYNSYQYYIHLYMYSKSGADPEGGGAHAHPFLRQIL